MKLLILALCVCAARAASFNSRNSGYKPWQSVGFAKVSQTTGFAKATAEVSVPAAKTVKEPVVPIVEVAKTVVHPFVPVVEVARAVVQPVVRTAVPVVQVAKVAAVAKYTNGKDADAEVLRSDSVVLPDGFQYTYETSNGIAAASSGSLKNVNNVDTLTVQGQYQYISPEGIPIQLSYVADENGYQPKSDLLPVAPPVPVAIARALEYLRTHPRKEETVRNF